MKKNKMNMVAGVLMTMLFLGTLVACGGGGGGGGPTNAPSANDPANPPDSPSTTAAPVISGFDFTLSEGDYWEYRWDYYHNSWAQGSTPSTTYDYGRFRVTLGAPVTISGVLAFPLVTTGCSGNGTDYDYAPRWQYIAIDDHQILGSNDGNSLTVLFDAVTGKWPGGGFFQDFGTGLNTATPRNIDNDYIITSAYSSGISTNQDQCEYFPGVGTICGDSSQSSTKYDFFKENIGAIGYYYQLSYSDCGGGFCTGGTWTTNVGLVSSSLRGEAVDHILEEEPNDSLAAAQTLQPGQSLIGDAVGYDSGWSTSQMPDGTDKVIDDLYAISVDENISISIDVTFDSSEATNDIDLYLFNSSGVRISSSLGDNAATGIYSESIRTDITAGKYYIGIDAFMIEAAGKDEYTLSWSKGRRTLPGQP